MYRTEIGGPVKHRKGYIRGTEDPGYLVKSLVKYAGHSYYADVSFDGEQFLLNESKVEKFYDFKRDEILNAYCCLPYHMVGPNQLGQPQFKDYPYWRRFLEGTKLLYKIWPPK